VELEPKRFWRKAPEQFDNLLAVLEDRIIEHLKTKGGPVNDELRRSIGWSLIVGMHWNREQPEPPRLEIVSRRAVHPSHQLSLFEGPEAVR
jgi:hypothetical protein